MEEKKIPKQTRSQVKVLIILPLCRLNPVTVLAAVVSERAGIKVDILKV